MIVNGVRAAILSAALLAAASDAHAACSVQKLAELPVTMSGLRPMISAKIDGTQAYFIADSGAFYSLISPGMASAAGLHVRPAPFELHLRGIGGDTSASVATVKDFTLDHIPLHNIEFIVGGTDTGTAGLIGQNVLGLADVEYDLPDGVIRLMRSHDCGHVNLAYWTTSGGYTLLPIEPRTQHQGHTVGTVLLDGVHVRAVFDTGAATSLLSLRAAARAGIKPGDAGVVAAGAGGGLGRQLIQTWIAPFSSLKIGDEEIHHFKIRIGDIDLPDADMLIGADFFISHRIYVDNANNRMFVTYTGGNIFDTQARRAEDSTSAAPTQDESQAPKDAEGYSRRGAVLASQHDLAKAIADFGRAIALAPREPRYLVQRAHAYLASGQHALALADLDLAVKLDPANLPALLDRAELHALGHERDPALADLDAAARVAPAAADQRRLMAGLYESLDAYERAIDQDDLWIAAHRDDSRLADALNSRCWVRALLGRDLDKALDDCNAALRLRPRAPNMLDSRGLVRLRMGDWDKAIGDYDAALALAPKMAWSLYGRGLARRHKGQAALGDADIAAALAIDPDLAGRARKLGIS